MKLTFLAITFSLLSVVSFGQKAAPAADARLTVEVEKGKTLQMNAAEIAKLPRREITAKDHDGKDVRYAGVELHDILTLAGAKLGADLKGKLLGAYVSIEAADGYR